jgi:hypothetical protein
MHSVTELRDARDQRKRGSREDKIRWPCAMNEPTDGVPQARWDGVRVEHKI